VETCKKQNKRHEHSTEWICALHKCPINLA
jgi:hypothetical protein